MRRYFDPVWLDRPYRKREYLVVAGNRAQFDDFCKFKLQEFEDGNFEFEGCDFFYYSNLDSIRGRKFNGVMTEGNYYERKDVDWGYIRTRLLDE